MPGSSNAEHTRNAIHLILIRRVHMCCCIECHMLDTRLLFLWVRASPAPVCFILHPFQVVTIQVGYPVEAARMFLPSWISKMVARRCECQWASRAGTRDRGKPDPYTLYEEGP